MEKIGFNGEGKCIEFKHFSPIKAMLATTKHSTNEKERETEKKNMKANQTQRV